MADAEDPLRLGEDGTHLLGIFAQDRHKGAECIAPRDPGNALSVAREMRVSSDTRLLIRFNVSTSPPTTDRFLRPVPSGGQYESEFLGHGGSGAHVRAPCEDP